MKLQCDSCPVRDRAACSSLSQAEREQLADLGSHRTLERGETLFHAGDDADVCATLNSGLLKIAHVDENGNERILSLVHPAGFVGELFSPIEHHDVVALTQSRLCLFDRARYEEAVERFPALSRALLRRSSQDLFEARAQIALDARKGAGAKVADLLRSLGRAASGSPCHSAASFDLPLTRGEMAGLLGLTIETVSRQLTRMEKDGIIAREGPRGIRIADPARLAVLAG